MDGSVVDGVGVGHAAGEGGRGAAAQARPDRQRGARIEKIRKSEATLRLLGPDGKPLPAGTAVQLEQTRHEFLFGCHIFMLKLIKGKWWTKEEKQREAGGMVKLHGFRVDYRVAVRGADGKKLTGTFTLQKDAAGAIEVKMK